MFRVQCSGKHAVPGAGVSDRTSLANAAEAAPALGPEIAEEDLGLGFRV